MKKVFSILMVAMIAAVFMASCVKNDNTTSNSSNDNPSVSNNNELADTYWKGKKNGHSEEVYSIYYLTFNSDYTCKLDIDEIIYGSFSSISFNGTYYYDKVNGLLTLTDNVFGQSYRDNFSISGNTLTLMHLENYITLNKQ